METPATQNVKIGLIGCGRWGKNHAKTLAGLPCNFVGVADSDPSKKEFINGLGTRYFSSHGELLPRVDAVVVAVPTSQHFSVVKDALDAGKHVLVEKPVTLDARQTAELVSLAHKKNLILSVGYIYRFHPIARELRERIKRAKNIHYITGRYIGGQNRLWQDSGAIINFGIHFIDVLNFILDARPEKVYAKRQNLLDPEREDSSVVKLIYPKFFATLELSCVHPEKARDMWVITDREKIFADFNKNEMRVYDFSMDAEGTVTGSQEPLRVDVPPGDPLKDELLYFIRAVSEYNPETYREIHNIGREEPHTTKICETALQSALSGKELEVRYLA